MGLAGPWWAEQDHVLAGMQEVELAEVLDDLLAHRALEGEVELLERLSCRKACRLDPALAPRATRARRPRSKAGLRRSAHSPSSPRGPARRAQAALAQPPAPSAPGR